MILEFSRQIFEKSLHIKCNEIPSNGNRAVPYGEMDRPGRISVLSFYSTHQMHNAIYSYTLKAFLRHDLVKACHLQGE